MALSLMMGAPDVELKGMLANANGAHVVMKEGGEACVLCTYEMSAAAALMRRVFWKRISYVGFFESVFVGVYFARCCRSTLIVLVFCK